MVDSAGVITESGTVGRMLCIDASHVWIRAFYERRCHVLRRNDATQIVRTVDNGVRVETALAVCGMSFRRQGLEPHRDDFRIVAADAVRVKCFMCKHAVALEMAP